ncbi:MAG TPA: bifunctional oligoribonuclease/PAP phosphatase NrnA [candidate division Zixibacteria bacterium]|jgi:phosphoesterase RecJ-like protein
MKEKSDQIIELVEKSKRILITSHIDPDGDSIGSQLALKGWLDNLAKEVRIINWGKTPSRYLFLDDKRSIEDLDSPSIKTWDADMVFVLECPNLERIGKVRELIREGNKIVNLDHHPDNSAFGDLNCIDTEASALGEIIYELLIYAGYKLNKEVATQLYSAILTDTGRFRFSNTTPKSLKICADLISRGANPKEINNKIYYNNSEPALRLLGFVLQNLEVLEDGKVSFMVIGQKNLKDFKVPVEDIEGFVDYSLFLKGVEVGALFKQKDKTLTKVSLRSQNSFDVASLARIFGGGGHKNAAGCTLNHDLNSAKKLILKNIKEQI